MGPDDAERGILLPADERIDVASAAEQAEQAGYDAVWTPELWGADAFVRVAELAMRTDEVRLGTAIANVFSRSPAVLAMAATSLDRLSDGRFTLGTGVSTPKAVEDLHGMDYDRPVRRAHETIELVKEFTGGDGRVEYDGELFEVQDFPAQDADVPVYHAALGPANRRVVGRLCDGWIPHNVPFDRLGTAFEEVAEAAAEAGRDPDAISVAPYVPAAVSEDESEARDAVRGHVAYYVGSGEGYRRAVATEFPDGADAVAEAWRDGDRAAAAEAVTDEMVASLGVAATPETAEERFADLLSGTPVDHAIVVVPAQAAEELAVGTIAALAPEP